jgi:hypothetical protein
VSKLISTGLLVLLLAPLSARAEDPAKPPPPPKWYDTFEIHGLVDTYYSNNLNVSQGLGNPLRTFDFANGFEVNYVKLTAQLAPTTAWTAGFRADVGFGQTAAVLNGNATSNATSPGALNTAAAPNGGIGQIAIQQAYLSVKLPHDIVVDGGKFVTNTGAEVIEAKDNWLYSRSLLFAFAIPFTHTGVRATIPIPGAEGFSVMGGLFNGFDNPPAGVNANKVGHLALLYSGPSNTTVVLNALYGYPSSAFTQAKTLLDAVLARSFGDLSLNVNADYGKVGTAKYWGISGMARYSFLGDKFRVSVRGEYLNDDDGVAVTGAPSTVGGPFVLGPGNKYYEITGSLSVPVGSQAEFRFEVRHDITNNAVLPSTTATPSDGQTTIQVAALAWF